MRVFPLSIAGKIVLILIAIALGIIWYGLRKPEFFKKLFRKREEQKEKGEKKEE
jgi:hypothetical protein